MTDRIKQWNLDAGSCHFLRNHQLFSERFLLHCMRCHWFRCSLGRQSHGQRGNNWFDPVLMGHPSPTIKQVVPVRLTFALSRPLATPASGSVHFNATTTAEENDSSRRNLLTTPSCAEGDTWNSQTDPPVNPLLAPV
jgi:hypothetical protein